MNSFKEGVKNFFPGYFSLVMATGIISIGAHLLHSEPLALVLFWLNVVFFTVLLAISLSRLIFFSTQVAGEIMDHKKGPGHFTLIAGTCILGNQLVVLFDQILLAKVLLIFACVCWGLIIYTFFTSITIRKNKPTLDQGISGSWLLAIVATQAIALLIIQVVPAASHGLELWLFISLGLYLIGCILYIYIMSLIVYRLSFFELTPDELGAPYWINMGATAITTLTGSMLIMNAGMWPFLEEILPFLKGFTLFFWCAGTWWIPLLIILGTWRHLVVKVALPTTVRGYNPSYWGMVFPLGMYPVGTYRLSEAIGVDFLMVIPQNFIYVAYFAWIAVMIGLLRHLLERLKGRSA